LRDGFADRGAVHNRRRRCPVTTRIAVGGHHGPPNAVNTVTGRRPDGRRPATGTGRRRGRGSVLETGVRQLRMAMAMAWGRRLNTRNLGRLVDDALATIEEFGEPGADAGQVIDGPLNDPAARLDFATR